MVISLINGFKIIQGKFHILTNVIIIEYQKHSKKVHLVILMNEDTIF